MRAVSLMEVECQEAAIRDKRRVVRKCAPEEDSGIPGMGGIMPRKYRVDVCGHMSGSSTNREAAVRWMTSLGSGISVASSNADVSRRTAICYLVFVADVGEMGTLRRRWSLAGGRPTGASPLLEKMNYELQ